MDIKAQLENYNTISGKELSERFLPVTLNVQPWPSNATCIEKIISRQNSPTGNVVYRVCFYGGTIQEIAAKELNKTHKQLVEDFELDNFRADQFPRTRKRLVTYASKKQQPASKKSRFQSRKKRSTSSDSEDPMSDFISHSSEEEEELAVENRVTKSGRQSVARGQTFENEFYPQGVVPAQQKKSFIKLSVPLCTEKEFVDQHSSHCFRCHEVGSAHGPVEVNVGPNVKRTRLMLCQTCSYAIHNNCMPASKRPAFDKETNEFHCVKCRAKKDCVYCKKNLFRKSTHLPFRCVGCIRSFHRECIKKSSTPALNETMKKMDTTHIYKEGYCIECITFGSRSGSVVAERMVDGERELLIKWKELSFRHTNWVAESWFKHAQATSWRAWENKKQEDSDFVPMKEIPIEWQTIDRILDVNWDKSRKKIQSVLAVMKDRSYDEAVWDAPPTEDETLFYPDYERALARYMQASKVKPPTGMKKLIAEVRKVATRENYEKHAYNTQPSFIEGGKLMAHQMEALNWLLYQWEQQESCILADDMGLGKTIQIITFLYVLFKKYKIYPYLIVVPNSTATNWVREFQKWAPEMTVAPYYGSSTARKLALDKEILDHHGNLKCHVVVATYESSMDLSRLSNVHWAVMVVDESQRLKNDESLLFRTLLKYSVDQITLLTGTPLQNNLKELFNIMHFIQPKAFHGYEAENYEAMTTENVEALHKRLRPHFLRRTKEEVLKTLPPKYELILPLSMTSLQKQVYKECLNREIYDTLNRATGSKIQRGLTSIFMNLRKTLNHPYLLDGVERPHNTMAEIQSAMINACEKLKVFHQMFPKLKAQGHRLLIFSTMTRTLDVLEDYLAYEKIGYTRIDGKCNERERVRSIDAFNAPNSKLDVFLLSTRAGGVGINLATADTVVIWDSDWNPYADLQAISRAHRIGQNNMVLILRFMTRLSVEERMLQIGKKKMALEHVVVERMKETEVESYDDIESIIKFGTEALFSDENYKDIHYDSAALDNLLDREQYRAAALEAQQKDIEEAEAGKTKNNDFSFAKIWKSNGELEDLNVEEEENDQQADFWQKFLEEKKLEKAKRKEEQEAALGRGARKRAAVKYAENFLNKPRLTQDKDVDYVFEDADDTDIVEEHHENISGKAAMSRIHLKPTPQNNSPQTIQPKVNTFQVNMGPAAAQTHMPPPQQHMAPFVMAPPPPPPPANNFTLLDGTYPEMLYHEMVQAAGSSIQKLKSVATKAFDDNMQNSPAFHQATRHLYNQVFQQLDLYFRQQFAMQYEKGIRDGIDRSICDGVYQDQVSVLERNFERFTQYVNNIMQIHFKMTEEQWEAGRQRRVEEETRRIEEARRVEEERIQRQIAQQAEYARQFQKKQYKKALQEQQMRLQQQAQRPLGTQNLAQAQEQFHTPPQQEQSRSLPLTPQQILVEQLAQPNQLEADERKRLFEDLQQQGVRKRMYLLDQQKKLEAQRKERSKEQEEAERREAQKLAQKHQEIVQQMEQQEAIRRQREREHAQKEQEALRQQAQRLIGLEEDLKMETRLREEQLLAKQRQEALEQEELNERMKRLQELREEDRRKEEGRRKEQERRKEIEEERRKQAERQKREVYLREEAARLAQQQRQGQIMRLGPGPTNNASPSTSKPVDTMTKELIELHMKFLSENQDKLTPEEVMKNFQALTTQMQEAKKSVELAEERRKSDTINAILLQEQQKFAKESQGLIGEQTLKQPTQLIDLTSESNAKLPESAFFTAANAKVPEPSSPAKLSYPSS